jgi:sugar/nucleoside kinase (ribokinase family)
MVYDSREPFKGGGVGKKTSTTREESPTSIATITITDGGHSDILYSGDSSDITFWADLSRR